MFLPTRGSNGHNWSCGDRYLFAHITIAKNLRLASHRLLAKTRGSYPWFRFYRTDVSEEKTKNCKLLRRKFFSAVWACCCPSDAPPNPPPLTFPKIVQPDFQWGEFNLLPFLRLISKNEGGGARMVGRDSIFPPPDVVSIILEFFDPEIFDF
jgi:hypothetical protein